MYCSFYGFSEKPFDITPDPRFLYLSPGHRETLASLIYGIQERRGFISIIGEVGTGKTTLLKTVLDRLDHTTKVAHIFNTDLSFKQMLLMALADFGIAKTQERLTKVEALQRLNEFAIQQLAKGFNVVLIVDEAQNLDNRFLENLRLLSNLETSRHKLVQIVLAGQPELDAKLTQPELRQLTQRITLRRYITPLNENEVSEYIRHRLKVANHQGPFPFSAAAERLIWEHSKGVPRKINILCDNAFLIGYGLNRRKIGKTTIHEAVSDLSWSPFLPERNLPQAYQIPMPFGRRHRLGFFLAAAVLVALCLVLAADYLFGNSAIFHEITKSFKAKSSVEAIQQSDKQDLTQPDFLLPPAENTGSNPADGAPPVRPSTNADKPLYERSKNDWHISKDSSNLSRFLKTKKPRNRPSSLDGILIEDLPPQVLQETSFQPHRIGSIWPQKPSVLNISQDDPPNGHNRSTNIDRSIAVVKRGESLSEIIQRTYGEYSQEILDEILRANPDIKNPDHIYVNQAIRLPFIHDSRRIASLP